MFKICKNLSASRKRALSLVSAAAILPAACAMLMPFGTAQATTVDYYQATSGTSTAPNDDNGPYSAMIGFEVSSGQLTVMVNNTSDPVYDVSQTVGAIHFQIDGYTPGTGSSPSLQSTPVNTLTVASNGSGDFTTGTTTATAAWEVLTGTGTTPPPPPGPGSTTTTGYQLTLEAIPATGTNSGVGQNGPIGEFIIGEANSNGLYSNALAGNTTAGPGGGGTGVDHSGSSILGQTLLANNQSFTINLPGLTTADTIDTSSVTVDFGNDPSDAGIKASFSNSSPTPEPAALALMGVAGLGLMLSRRRRSA